MFTGAVRRTRVAMRTLLVGCFFGCREPLSPESEPGFLSAESVLPFFVGTSDPEFYACPKPEAPPPSSVRRTLPGTTATITLPAAIPVTVVPFRNRRGGVIQVGSLGVIAVSFDDQLVLQRQRNAFFSRIPVIPEYNQQCTLPLARGTATVLASTLLAAPVDSASPGLQYFTEDMTVLAVEPSGRRINLRLLGAEQSLFLGSEFEPFRSLLAAALSLQW